MVTNTEVLEQQIENMKVDTDEDLREDVLDSDGEGSMGNSKERVPKADVGTGEGDEDGDINMTEV